MAGSTRGGKQSPRPRNLLCRPYQHSLSFRVIPASPCRRIPGSWRCPKRTPACLGLEHGTLEPEALAAVQSLEPAGVGARTLSECLKLQLVRRAPVDELAVRIVENYLDALSKSRYGLSPGS